MLDLQSIVDESELATLRALHIGLRWHQVTGLVTRLAVLSSDLPIRVEDQGSAKFAPIVHVAESPARPGAVAVLYTEWMEAAGA